MDGRFQAARVISERPTGTESSWYLMDKSEAAISNVKPGTPQRVIQQFDDVQREMDSLRLEFNLLHRRDDTINFYMNRLDEELRLAARLQRDFLPKSLPQLGDVRFHTLFRPAGYVSGDIYDVMRLDEQHVAFYIADAVGHGMPAALLTMFLKHALATKEIYGGGYRLLKPSESMARLNEALRRAKPCSCHIRHGNIWDDQREDVGIDDGMCRSSDAGAAARGGRREESANDRRIAWDFPWRNLYRFHHEAFAGRSPRLIYRRNGRRLWRRSHPPPIPNAGARNCSIGVLCQRRRCCRTFPECADKESGSLQPKDDLTIVVVEVGGRGE